MEDRQEVRWSFAEVNQTGNPPTNFLVLEGDLKCQTRCFVIFMCVSRLFYVIFSIPKIRRTPIQRRVLNYVSETISSRLNISRLIVGSLPLLSFDGLNDTAKCEQFKLITVTVAKNYFRKISLYQSVWEKKRKENELVKPFASIIMETLNVLERTLVSSTH